MAVGDSLSAQVMGILFDVRMDGDEYFRHGVSQVFKFIVENLIQHEYEQEKNIFYQVQFVGEFLEVRFFGPGKHEFPEAFEREKRYTSDDRPWASVKAPEDAREGKGRNVAVSKMFDEMESLEEYFDMNISWSNTIEEESPTGRAGHLITLRLRLKETDQAMIRSKVQLKKEIERLSPILKDEIFGKLQERIRRDEEELKKKLLKFLKQLYVNGSKKKGAKVRNPAFFQQYLKGQILTFVRKNVFLGDPAIEEYWRDVLHNKIIGKILVISKKGNVKIVSLKLMEEIVEDAVVELFKRIDMEASLTYRKEESDTQAQWDSVAKDEEVKEFLGEGVVERYRQLLDFSFKKRSRGRSETLRKFLTEDDSVSWGAKEAIALRMLVLCQQENNLERIYREVMEQFIPFVQKSEKRYGLLGTLGWEAEVFDNFRVVEEFLVNPVRRVYREVLGMVEGKDEVIEYSPRPSLSWEVEAAKVDSMIQLGMIPVDEKARQFNSLHINLPVAVPIKESERAFLAQGELLKMLLYVSNERLKYVQRFSTEIIRFQGDLDTVEEGMRLLSDVLGRLKRLEYVSSDISRLKGSDYRGSLRLSQIFVGLMNNHLLLEAGADQFSDEEKETRRKLNEIYKEFRVEMDEFMDEFKIKENLDLDSTFLVRSKDDKKGRMERRAPQLRENMEIFLTADVLAKGLYQQVENALNTEYKIESIGRTEEGLDKEDDFQQEVFVDAAMKEDKRDLGGIALRGEDLAIETVGEEVNVLTADKISTQEFNAGAQLAVIKNGLVPIIDFIRPIENLPYFFTGK